jgi:Holliday junction resolvase
MSNPSKAKGTAWESAIVSFLQSAGWPYVERRTLAGSKDRGDIAGIPGVVIEAKATKTAALGAYVDEANQEAVNDSPGGMGGSLGVVWLKRRGKSSAGNGYVVMDGWAFVALLNEAGYGNYNAYAEQPQTTTAGEPS